MSDAIGERGHGRDQRHDWHELFPSLLLGVAFLALLGLVVLSMFGVLP
jgi:hypothetical protein